MTSGPRENSLAARSKLSDFPVFSQEVHFFLIIALDASGHRESPDDIRNLEGASLYRVWLPRAAATVHRKPHCVASALDPHSAAGTGT